MTRLGFRKDSRNIIRNKRPNRAFCAALACAGLVLTSSCQSVYVQDRLKDAGEILDLSLTFGGGVEIGARVTEVIQVGGGAVDATAFGWMDGRFAKVREQRGEFGASVLHVYHYRRDGNDQLLDVREPRWADVGYREYPMSMKVQADRGWFDVGGTFHLALIGVNLSLKVEEFFDFLTGLAGVDLLGDDAYTPSLAELRQRAHSLSADERANAFDALLRRGEDIHGYAIYTNPEVKPAFQRRAIEALDGQEYDPLDGLDELLEQQEILELEGPEGSENSIPDELDSVPLPPDDGSSESESTESEFEIN